MPQLRSLDLYALGAMLALVAAIGYWAGASSGDSGGVFNAPAVTVLAVDRSASVVHPRDRHERWTLARIEQEARGALERGDDLALLTYDRGVQRRIGPVSAEEFFAALRAEAGTWLISLPFDDGAALDPAYGTDLTGAVLVAREIVREGEGRRPPGTLVVIGDGASTTPGADQALMDRRFEDVRLVAPGPPTRSDVRIHRVRAPESVEPGVAVRVDVELGLRPGTDVPEGIVLDWTLTSTSVDTIARGRNVAASRTGSVRVDLPDGDANPLAFTRTFVTPVLEEGTVELEVRGRFARADRVDAFPENASGSATWVVGDPIRVLVVLASDANLPDAVAIFRGRSFEGIEFTGAAVSDLEALLAADDPAPFDAVVTLDLPLASLPDEALAEFVQERGGGWVHAAGWPRLRDESGSALGPLLALEPDSEPIDPRDIIVLMDGSGSMAGERWQRARAALERLLPAIPVRDRIFVRFFNHALGSVAMSFAGVSGAFGRDRRAEELEVARRDLRAMQIPGGQTNIGYSLEGLVQERKSAREDHLASGADAAEWREGLVILITDGNSALPGGPQGAKKIRTSLAELGDSLVAVQVGDDPDGLRYLGYLVGDRSDVRSAGELKGVLAILQAAIQSSGLLDDAQVVRGPVIPSTSGPGVDPARDALAEVAREAQAIALAEASSGPLVLGSLVPCRARVGAAPFLMSEAILAQDATEETEAVEGRPSHAVGAYAARGRGMVCGLAFVLFDAEGRTWAPRLGRRIEFLGPLLRAMGRRARSTRSETVEERGPTITLAGGGITLGGLDADAPPTLAAEIVGPPAVNAFGVLEPGNVVAEVVLAPPTFGSSESRRAPRPDLLDQFPRGTRLALRPAKGDAGTFQPVTFAADGPSEAQGDPDLPAAAFRARAQARALDPPHRQRDGILRAHPLVRWLLVASVFVSFAGAVLGSILRRRTLAS